MSLVYAKKLLATQELLLRRESGCLTYEECMRQESMLNACCLGCDKELSKPIWILHRGYCLNCACIKYSLVQHFGPLTKEEMYSNKQFR